ncbi:MAG: hydrogenase small subunit [Fibrobacterota bacterium]
MALSRRTFLKSTVAASAIAAAPALLLSACKKEIAEALKRSPVIWIQAQSCSGCSVSLLNGQTPGIAELITQKISLNFHQTLCGGTGEALMQVIEKAVEKKRNDYVLIVEGAIPSKSDRYCTLGEKGGTALGMREWILNLGANAKALVAVGACAAFGGIPAASLTGPANNPTGAQPLSALFPGKPVVNVPGCPPHPDWMMGTLIHFLLKGLPELDEYNRPKMFFGVTVHEKCIRLADYEAGRFTEKWGEPGCLYLLGCLGMDSGCDIPTRRWLSANSCTGCGSGCIGCTEPVFPDTGGLGLYKHLRAGREAIERDVAHAPLRNALLKRIEKGAAHV